MSMGVINDKYILYVYVTGTDRVVLISQEHAGGSTSCAPSASIL